MWLTEHHFDGTVAYADPLVFAGAVAARTNRVKIGFAVVEMALHHPVRLAVQTALIDHLSRGRLIVGTGRGSIFNEYEYIGFGVTLEQGRDMIPEAEELLIKAWTGEDVDHQGRYWKSAFPELRPQPYQKPHPPLVRACATEGSLKAMAGIGRPVLIGVQTIDTLRQRLQLYRDSMSNAGFGEEAVEEALDQTWAQRGLYVGGKRSRGAGSGGSGPQQVYAPPVASPDQVQPWRRDPRSCRVNRRVPPRFRKSPFWPAHPVG